MKDELNDNLNGKQIKQLLETNATDLPDKMQAPTILHIVADGMLWGR